MQQIRLADARPFVAIGSSKDSRQGPQALAVQLRLRLFRAEPLSSRHGEERITIVLGVDIGVSGALAILESSGELVDVFDMPCLQDGPAKRRSVNAPLLAEIVAKSHATSAFVEYVGPRPQEGAVGAFAFGRSRGVIEGVLAALGLPVAFLTPPQWKRLIGILPGRAGAKDAARSEAIRRWPGKASFFARVKDDGRAEAALIALAGLKRLGDSGG